MVNVSLFTLSSPPELEIEDSFFNKVGCYIQELGMLDFIQIDIKGVKSGMCYPAQIEFISTAKKQTVKVVSLDLDKGKPFKMVVEK